MTKRILLHSPDEAHARMKELCHAASATRASLKSLLQSDDAIQILRMMKFEKIGYDPLDSRRALNLTEQLNQTFTYLASLQAAVEIFNRHPSIQSLTLNLGTASGPDLQTDDTGGIVAEIFASVTPSNNGKLRKDVAKVDKLKAKYKYVFFLCPEYSGKQKSLPEFPSVVIIALDSEKKKRPNHSSGLKTRR
jgi:hypothetical protein